MLRKNISLMTTATGDSARLPTITIIPEDLVIECITHSPDFYATLLIFYSEAVFKSSYYPVSISVLKLFLEEES